MYATIQVNSYAIQRQCVDLQFYLHKCFNSLLQEGGIRGLYRGFVPTLTGMVIC